jgi:hypothetical protein
MYTFKLSRFYKANKNGKRWTILWPFRNLWFSQRSWLWLKSSGMWRRDERQQITNQHGIIFQNINLSAGHFYSHLYCLCSRVLWKCKEKRNTWSCVGRPSYGWILLGMPVPGLLCDSSSAAMVETQSCKHRAELHGPEIVGTFTFIIPSGIFGIMC